MLGIVIGIMSVILMLSIGESAQRFIVAQISSFGSDMVFVASGPGEVDGQPTIFVKESLTYRDLQRLKSQSWILQAVGKTMQSDEITGRGASMSVQVVGTGPDEALFSDIKFSEGDFFTQGNLDERGRMAVLGADVARKIFQGDSAIGKQIKIGGTNFTVVGVMQAGGGSAFQNRDKQVFIPVTTAMDLYNKKYLTMIQFRPSIALQEAKLRAMDFFRERHNIANPENDLSKDDFHIQTQEDIVRTASTVTDILQILLVAIAAISLIVGGIGIMNIMYVSVTERIKEIGLRKAIGATRQAVLGQFLVEAVMLTGLGGVIGVILGIGFSWIGIIIIQQFQSGWSFGLSGRGIILGLLVATAIGIVFGYFPARRAARMNPIDALRAE